MNNAGLVKGEMCNRNSCKGILDEHEKEGGCSCHINPPCSYCTTDSAYCPECGWEASDEVDERPLVAAGPYSTYKSKTFADLDCSKIDWVYEGGTHFTMNKHGRFPKGTTRAEVEKEVKGTFGGRFAYFDEVNCQFEYIAYTD